LIDDSGRLIHPEWVDEYFSTLQGISRYQVYQPDRDDLEVRLVSKSGSDPALSQRIHSALQDRFGPTMRISIEYVDQIELTPAGKLRTVVSDVRPVLS
jgi:hypothetical protein